MGPYVHIDSSLSPQYVGIRAYCHSCAEECGALVGGMAAIVPARSLKMADAGVNRYLWNPFYCYSKLQIINNL